MLSHEPAKGKRCNRGNALRVDRASADVFKHTRWPWTKAWNRAWKLRGIRSTATEVRRRCILSVALLANHGHSDDLFIRSSDDEFTPKRSLRDVEI